MGRMPGLALFGVQEEESELEEIELVAQGEGPGSDSEEDGPGPRMYFPLSLSFVLFMVFFRGRRVGRGDTPL